MHMVHSAQLKLFELIWIQGLIELFNQLLFQVVILSYWIIILLYLFCASWYDHDLYLRPTGLYHQAILNLRWLFIVYIQLFIDEVIDHFFLLCYWLLQTPSRHAERSGKLLTDEDQNIQSWYECRWNQGVAAWQQVWVGLVQVEDTKGAGHRPEEGKGRHCLAPPLGRQPPIMRQRCWLI